MRLKLLPLLCLALAFPVWALQDDGADDSTSDSASTGYLHITYDQQGDTEVALFLSQPPASWDAISLSLSQMLHCSQTQFHHPKSQANAFQEFNSLSNLSADERRKMIQAITDQSGHELQAHCAHTARKSGFALSSSMDTTNLVRALQAEGVAEFEFGLIVPDSPYAAFKGVQEAKHSFPGMLPRSLKDHSAWTSLPFNDKTVAPKIEVAFGWSRAEVARTLTRTLVFLLLPFVILLRMRAIALKTFRDDPSTAWFAYMKTLGWCTNGGMLLWYLTNLGARKDLEQFLNFVFSGPNVSIAINIATYFLPAALIYLSCIGISHRVFVDVKNAQYTWAQFLAEHSVTLARIIVPIALLSVAVRFYAQPRIFVSIMFGAWVSLIVLGRWRMKLTSNYPKIVLAGELRDRIFGFAKTLGVKLQQVIILPAQRQQVANAFASAANTVIFTDFLLERMSKREVDAIAGHELTHLKRSHPAKLQMATIAAVFAPVWLLGLFGGSFGLIIALLFRSGIKLAPVTIAHVYSMLSTLSEWGIDSAIAVALAFAGVYALSRRFERQADAGAVSLTNDPEAMITALLKLNSLNLMPLSWGKGTGASLTHPSTLKRIQRIARQAGMSNAQLEQLIGQLSVEKLSHAEVAGIAEQHKAGEHYGKQTKETTVSHKSVTRSQNVLFFLIGLMVVPPALIELAVEHLHLTPRLHSVVLEVGIVLVIAAYFLAIKMLPLRGLARQKAARLDQIGKSGIDVSKLELSIVGFAPGAAPRIYLGKYNFDIGALVLSKDRLVFLGRQLKFSIARRQVLSIQTGRGAPGWWPQQRIYVCWQDETTGKAETFNLSPQEPSSLFELNARIHELYSKLLTWRLRGHPQHLPTELELLPAFQIGEITCMKPRQLIRPKVQLQVLLFAALGIWVISSILGIRSGYLWLTVLALRIFETLPYVFYREPRQARAATPIMAKTATAAASV